eukprot:TRINITY_DN83359_c0_g1_i1.p1 TRINITY_DN83359_c0_g1~~TRINITY_DN83359_c0_g1_i1.p1  ORF type:complete len:333 (-),score=76.19 TRINITY_DN83359_c0_g1_i1:395-1393(-)
MMSMSIATAVTLVTPASAAGCCLTPAKFYGGIGRSVRQRRPFITAVAALGEKSRKSRGLLGSKSRGLIGTRRKPVAQQQQPVEEDARAAADLGADGTSQSYSVKVSDDESTNKATRAVVAGALGTLAAVRRRKEAALAEEAPAGSRWNFAFGANINPWKLKTKRGIMPQQEVAGRLPGWRLVFNHSGGMGNVEAVPAEEKDRFPDAVHGMLLLLEDSDFDKLAEMEHEYNTTTVDVHAYDGRIIRAEAFTSPEDYRLQSYPPPPARYINLIRSGAKSSKLDGDYQAWLATISGVEDRGLEYWDHPGKSRRGDQVRRRLAASERSRQKGKLAR